MAIELSDGDELGPEFQEAIKKLLEPASEALAEFARSQLPPIEWQYPSPYEHLFEAIRESIAATFDFGSLDLSNVFRGYPENLDDHLEQLEDLAELAKRGFAVTWAAPPDVLDDLLAATTDEECHAILVSRQDAILDHLTSYLTDNPDTFADSCNEAVAAARLKMYAVAQSHAGNIIDSIILRQYQPPDDKRTRVGREKAMAHALGASDDDQPIAQFFGHLTIRPAYTALKTWHLGDDVLPAFSRHATSHCVGGAGVFSAAFAISSVMFAASLSLQFPDQ